jgi:signal peptidase I
MKLKKAIKIVAAAICYFVFAAFVLILLLIGAPRVAGIKLYSVVSGSMSPFLPVNSVVFVSGKGLEGLKESDVITFRTAAGDTVTHRVTVADYANDVIITKGDVNELPDDPISFSQVEGRVVFAVNNLGKLVAFAKTARGLITLLLMPIAASALNGAASKLLKQTGDKADTICAQEA